MHPRRVVLLLILAGLIGWNVYRYEHHRSLNPALVSSTSTPANNSPDLASDTAPVWNAFDHAAGLRDAADDQFQPALTALHDAMHAVPNPNLKANADVLASVRGCSVWLTFYRQNLKAPANDPWKVRTTNHLNSCVKYHADIAQ